MSISWRLPILFGTGLAAGFVDSIAGGGGLITLPVLLSLGLEPKDALGTNKLQASFGSGSASWHYARARAVDPRDCVRGFCCSFVGAALGSMAVQQLARALLERIIPIVLLVVAAYTLLKPRFGAEDVRARMNRRSFDFIFGLGIGFYDGFLGPGTGTFWTMAFMFCLGFNMLRATAYTKVMNFASNLSSLAFFLVTGHVLFLEGIIMGAGQLLGAKIGAGIVITRGTKFIRPVFLAAVFAITLKLLLSPRR